MSDVDIKVLEARMHKDTIKKCVAYLCAVHPQVKGDYRLLVYYFWKDVCHINISLKTFNEIRKIPSGGTIERRLRELRQEDELLAQKEGRMNKYAPLPGTSSKRVKNAEVYRQHYSELGALLHWVEEGMID